MMNLLKFKYPPQVLVSTIVSLFFVWLLMSIFYGERILAGNGLGFDGVRYTKYAQNFYMIVFDHQLSYYFAQRIFPSFLIYIVTRLFHLTINEINAPILFSLLNAGMLMFCVVIWVKLIKQLKWNLSIQILSFSGLFLNYAHLKMAFYYPTLTDTTAFTFGMLMLYFYIKESPKYLLITAVLGAFTFPTLLYASIVLFLFPMNNQYKIAETKSLKLNILFAIIQSFIITSLWVYIWYHHDWLGAARALGSNYALPVLCMSMVALFLYLSVCLYPLSKYYRKLLSNFTHILNLKRVIIALIVITLVKLTMEWIVSPDATSVLTLTDYIIHIAGQALAYPFNYLISHVIYYGPIVCLLLFYGKEVIAHLINVRATGLFFLTGLYIILSTGSESRQLINFLPIAVYMIAEVLNKNGLSLRFAMLFTFISLGVSKCWLPINHGEWPSLHISPPEVTLQFPMQWYFMSIGPWVSHQMFFINTFIALAAFFAVFVLIRTRWNNCSTNQII